jgi:hypothetical protein
MELVIANIYWNTTDDSLNAITPNTQVIPKIGMTAPKVFEADLEYNKSSSFLIGIFFKKFWTNTAIIHSKNTLVKNLVNLKLTLSGVT